MVLEAFFSPFIKLNLVYTKKWNHNNLRTSSVRMEVCDDVKEWLNVEWYVEWAENEE